MTEQTSTGQISAAQFIFAAAASLFTCLLPNQAAAREPEAIPCPQTGASPEAQAMLDAGTKPEIIKSWYKPGLVNPQGFCTITVSPDGTKLFQRYNEATSVAQIPVRFEFHPNGFDVYAGPKGLPFGSGPPDMTCWAPGPGESAADCRMAFSEKGGFTIRLKEGRGIETESILAIDPKEMFGTALKEQSRFVHFQMNYGFLDTAALMSMFTPAGNTYEPVAVDCTNDIWKNIITEVLVSTGPRKDNSIQPTASVQIVGDDVSLLPLEADEIPPQVARLTAGSNGDSDALIRQILTNEAVQIDITTACEGRVSKAYTTEVARLMAHVYGVIKPRLLQQL